MFRTIGDLLRLDLSPRKLSIAECTVADSEEIGISHPLLVDSEGLYWFVLKFDLKSGDNYREFTVYSVERFKGENDPCGFLPMFSGKMWRTGRAEIRSNDHQGIFDFSGGADWEELSDLISATRVKVEKSMGIYREVVSTDGEVR